MTRLHALALSALTLAGGAPVGAATLQPLTTQTYASGVNSPVAFVQDPTDDSRQMVVEQGGRIRVIVHGSVRPNSFLDVSGSISTGGERGLLGLAFDPAYAT